MILVCMFLASFVVALLSLLSFTNFYLYIYLFLSAHQEVGARVQRPLCARSSARATHDRTRTAQQGLVRSALRRARVRHGHTQRHHRAHDGYSYR